MAESAMYRARRKRYSRRGLLLACVGMSLAACVPEDPLETASEGRDASLSGVPSHEPSSATPSSGPPDVVSTSTATATKSPTPSPTSSPAPSATPTMTASPIPSTPTLTPSSTSTPTVEATAIPPTETPRPVQYSGELRGTRCLEEVEFIAGHEITCGDKERPVVMMTYDDSGSRDSVAYLLDVYRAFGVQASFFILGEWLALKTAEKHYRFADLAERMVSEGHLLGCHGYTHDYFTKLEEREVNWQVEQFLSLVETIIPGYQVRFIRFPYGARNLEIRKIAASWGLQSVFWSFDSGGQDEGTAERVLGQSQQGTIVLSHLLRRYDISQAEIIVEGLIHKGLQPVTVAQGIHPSQCWG